MTHRALQTLAYCGAGELFGELRASFNRVKPADATAIPSLRDWTGIASICDHIFCRYSIDCCLNLSLSRSDQMFSSTDPAEVARFVSATSFWAFLKCLVGFFYVHTRTNIWDTTWTRFLCLGSNFPSKGKRVWQRFEGTLLVVSCTGCLHEVTRVICFHAITSGSRLHIGCPFTI